MQAAKYLLFFVPLLACVASAQNTKSRAGSLRAVLGTSPTFNIYTDHPVELEDSTRYKRSDESGAIGIASAYLQRNHRIAPSSVRITDAYTDQASGITHIYAKQVVGGIGVANGLANVNIDRNGRIISSSQSFVPESALSADALLVEFWAGFENSTRSEKLSAAISLLASYTNSGVGVYAKDIVVADGFVSSTGDTGFVVSGLPNHLAPSNQGSVSKELLRLDGRVVPVWHICMQQHNHWWSAYVGAGADTGRQEVHAIYDWASAYYAFKVLPRSIVSPDDGDLQLVADPANPSASPHGWVTGNTTTGNNVWAQTDPSGNGTPSDVQRRPVTNSSGVFDFPFNRTQEPGSYADFAVTQLFYTVNTMHDLSFVYGFDEAAGNFQDINFSGKGVGGDHIVAFAQDGGSTNNAVFTSPPDGQNGIMKMYLWTAMTPERDGDLEQDIVAHEFTHGISNRLTGGPANADCLASGEPAGMGEGWSDTVANILRIKPGMTRESDMEMGRYVHGQNIRMYPYSTSTTTNPQTFKYLDREEYQEVHAIGGVWATMLYEVLWNIIDSSGGISDDLFKHDLSKGNAIVFQILLDGMKLQPCNPSFIDAREAIVQAEHNLTGDKYKCAVWHGFAKRGLGIGASANMTAHVEDFGVPPECIVH
ncbi:hypothetical protein EV175_005434 [Coemansia sp. RSA 1933]|nr:hypothetical protein EV175_005434 [Coemansia sp. RSA 1933]